MQHSLGLEQEWMNLMGPKTTCSLIHPSSTCLFQIINKSGEVVKKSSKLYALLYLTILIVRFRKIHSEGKIKKAIKYLCKDYLWSLLFMSWLVGGMKLALCILNGLNSPLDGRAAPLLSLLGSPSIYCIDMSRRHEVVLFTFVRACRSAYIYFKKRYKFNLNNQKQLSFIALYGVLSYFYFEKPNRLRNNQMLRGLWGNF